MYSSNWKIDRAFSPWALFGSGYQGFALGWYMSRLWRSRESLHLKIEMWGTRTLSDVSTLLRLEYPVPT